MLRIHTRPHRTPVTALSSMALCYPTGPVSKGAQNALDAPIGARLPTMQEPCQKPCQYPIGDRPPGIPSTITFDLDHLYLLIYIAYILRYISTISKDIYPTRPKGIDRTIYPPIPKRIQNFLGELEKLLGATNISRLENFLGPA